MLWNEEEKIQICASKCSGIKVVKKRRPSYHAFHPLSLVWTKCRRYFSACDTISRSPHLTTGALLLDLPLDMEVFVPTDKRPLQLTSCWPICVWHIFISDIISVNEQESAIKTLVQGSLKGCEHMWSDFRITPVKSGFNTFRLTQGLP